MLNNKGSSAEQHGLGGSYVSLACKHAINHSQPAEDVHADTEALSLELTGSSGHGTYLIVCAHRHARHVLQRVWRLHFHPLDTALPGCGGGRRAQAAL